MRAVTRETCIATPEAGQWIGRGIGLVSALCLVGCAGTQSAKPQYPIYMQDMPSSAEAAPMPITPQTSAPQTSAKASAAQVSAEPLAPTITGTGSQGAITSTDLPPPPSANTAPPPPPPPPPAAATSTTTVQTVYVLQAGDTLFGVSRRFGVPIRSIYQLNSLTAESVTRPGQKIRLPDSAVDKGVEERATGKGLEKVKTVVAVKSPAPVAPPRPVVAPSTTTTTTTTVNTPAPTKPVVAPAAPTPAPVPAPVAKPAPVPAPATGGAFPNQAEIIRLGKGRFVWPHKGPVLVPFGQLATNVRNDGLNIGGTEGAPVVSTAAGSVIYVGDQMKELGNTVYIKHDDGFYSGYLHLASIRVKTGQKVAQGETIGTLGRSGAVDKPQLHFEIRYTPSTDIARPIDPSLVLP